MPRASGNLGGIKRIRCPIKWQQRTAYAACVSTGRVIAMSGPLLAATCEKSFSQVTARSGPLIEITRPVETHATYAVHCCHVIRHRMRWAPSQPLGRTDTSQELRPHGFGLQGSCQPIGEGRQIFHLVVASHRLTFPPLPGAFPSPRRHRSQAAVQVDGDLRGWEP